MRTIMLPVSCQVASYQGGRRLIISHGETAIKVSDALVMDSSQPDLIAVRRLCAAAGRAEA